MFCRKCGKEILDDSEFCFECGARVEIPVRQSVSNTVNPIVTENDKPSIPRPISTLKINVTNDKKTDEVSLFFDSKEGCMKCSKCGSKVLSPSITYCPYCGNETSSKKSDLSTNSTSAEALNETQTPIQPKVKGNSGEGIETVGNNKENTRIRKKPSLWNLGVISSFVAIVFVIWGIWVCNGTERGFYHYPDFIYHMYGEYSWGIFLQILGISLIGIFVMICVVIQLYNRNLQDSIIVICLADISYFIAALYNFSNSEDSEYIRNIKTEAYQSGTSITDKSDAIRLYFSDQKIFGIVFLVIGIIITATFMISLTVYLIRKRNTKPISAEKKEITTRRIFFLTKIFVSLTIGIVMVIMHFNLRQFEFERKNEKWFISKYYGSETILDLPIKHLGENIAGISESAFEGSKIILINISLEERNGNFRIEEKAFYNSQELESVNFTNNSIMELQHDAIIIGDRAFANCVNLVMISIKESKYSSGISTYNLNNLSRSNVVKYGKNSFENCTYFVDE